MGNHTERSFQGPVEKVVAQLAALGSFEVRWSECSSVADLDERRDLARVAGGEDFYTALRHYFMPWNDWSYVVEDDHLLIIPERKALEFWKRWWADEQAKKK